ncbi:MAG: glutamine amidotransferase [Tissierellia bacterium]|nr:glutamine amidotransferase [Tissierellia bacterium]
MAKILIAGESWTTHTIHQKGFDTFTTTTYEEGVHWLKAALESGGHTITYIPNHRVQYDFPSTREELADFDVVMLSDIGSNTLLLPDLVFMKGQKQPNKCELIKEFVLEGGAFIMVGGYMAFSGIDAKSRYGMTAIQDVLPVTCLQVDDRVETPEGIYPVVVDAESPVLAGVEGEWPHFLGYNKTIAREEAKMVATIGGDPFIAIGQYGKGKSAVFTSDCAPHWGPVDFIEWKHYPTFWNNLIQQVTEK